MDNELLTPDKYAMMVVKQDGREALYDNTALPEALKLYLFSRFCLSLVLENIINLSEKEIRILYPVLEKPDEEHGDWWKPLVINYLNGQEVLCYLLNSDNNCEKKAQELKHHIRQVTSEAGQEDWAQRSIYNSRVHVVDSCDYRTSFPILFGPNGEELLSRSFIST